VSHSIDISAPVCLSGATPPRGASRPAAVGALALLAPLFLLLSGCNLLHHRPPPMLTQRYEHAVWTQIPGWSTDAVQEAWPAFLASCHVLRGKPEWVEPCAAAEAVAAGSPAAVHAYFETYFEPYRLLKVPSVKREDTGLITGYYEPLLLGSRTRTPQFGVPLYAAPPDLLVVDLSSVYPELKKMRLRGRVVGKKVVPYYSRAELASGETLQGQEIVWVQDPLEAFLLEVQGSGRVQLPDGQVIRVQYADQNGQPYKAIGRYLVQHGDLTAEQASIPGIRDFLARNPDRMQEVLNANPSVVFFKEAPVDDPGAGPKGSQGIPLTPGRSIAVDPGCVPLGAPVFLSTTLPDSGTQLQRLVVAQDTGGAISGAPRADFFFGTGTQAGELAGKMRQSGSMWLLWPRTAALPSS
jgi:membrane-bound lytic murein transglycosylase A